MYSGIDVQNRVLAHHIFRLDVNELILKVKANTQRQQQQRQHHFWLLLFR